MSSIKKLLVVIGLGLSVSAGFMFGPAAAIVFFLGYEFALAMPSGRVGVNTLGTLATGLVVQEALALVFTKRPMLNAITFDTRDLQGSPVAKYNQTITTRTLGLPTVQNFGGAASATADVDVNVTINNFKELAYTFTPIEYSSTDRNLIAERAEPMAIALANYFVDTIAALWTAANFPLAAQKTTVAAAWGYVNTILVLRKAMNQRGIQDPRRFFVYNSDVEASLLGDQLIVSALNNPDNGGAIASGRLPQVGGFGLDDYPDLPANGINLIGFAGTPQSTVLATRVVRDPRELIPNLPYPGNMGLVTEPRTGLTVMVLEYIDQATLNLTSKLVFMHGQAVGDSKKGQLLVSA